MDYIFGRISGEIEEEGTLDELRAIKKEGLARMEIE